MQHLVREMAVAAGPGCHRGSRSAAARGGPCRVYMCDVKLKVADDVVYYPDVMVACGPVGESPLLETAPCLVVEVLSPGTEQIDRREKLAAYKKLPGLQAYLIVHQERMRVERVWRDEEGIWWGADVVDLGRVPIPCPELVLTLDEIYEGSRRPPEAQLTERALSERDPGHPPASVPPMAWSG